MSIATAIQNAQGKVANAYTAVSGKGGTLPATQNLSNLPAAINSIQVSSGSVVYEKAPRKSGTFNYDAYSLVYNGTSKPKYANKALNFNNSITLTSGTYTVYNAFGVQSSNHIIPSSGIIQKQATINL